MLDLLIPLVVGLCCFFGGWFAHAWFASPEREEADAFAGPQASRWICPQCKVRRELPPELDGKVLVCNNCKLRLVRDV